MCTTRDLDEPHSLINSPHFGGIVDQNLFSRQADSVLNLSTSHERVTRINDEFLISIQSEFLLLKTRWSTHERKRLYRALARFGRNDIRSIAQRVRSKNIVQVQRYLYLLDILARSTPRIKMRDIPAAHEAPEQPETNEALTVRSQTPWDENELAEDGSVLHCPVVALSPSRARSTHPGSIAALHRALTAWLRPIVGTIIALAIERRKNTQEVASASSASFIFAHASDVRTALWLILPNTNVSIDDSRQHSATRDDTVPITVQNSSKERETS
jgi:hypothetical protein